MLITAGGVLHLAAEVLCQLTVLIHRVAVPTDGFHRWLSDVSPRLTHCSHRYLGLDLRTGVDQLRAFILDGFAAGAEFPGIVRLAAACCHRVPFSTRS